MSYYSSVVEVYPKPEAGFALELIPVYGRYCGPGLGLGAGESGVPVSGIDKRCQAHDATYRSTLNKDRLAGDRMLFRSLFTALSAVGVGDIVFAGRPSGGNAYRFAAIPLFGGLIVYRSTK